MKEYSSQIIFEKIIEFADIKNKQVLEIGCGDGRISSLLAGKPEKLVAIDSDKQKIEEARNTVTGVDFQIESGENMTFPDNCFDLVIFTLSLHHQDSNKAIDEARRVLKNKGKILVIEPGIEGEIESLYALLNNEDNEKIEAQKSINNSGLNLIDSEIFSAEWVFEDKEDLFQSAFKYYDMPFDPKTALKMSNLLGDRIESHPIVLVDSMIIQSLCEVA
jgi:SAM-dependent methyltransferase